MANTIIEEAQERLAKTPRARMKVSCADVLALAGAPAAAPTPAPAEPDHETLRELDLLRGIVGAAEEKGRKRLGKSLDAYRSEFPNPDAPNSADEDAGTDDDTDSDPPAE